MAITKVYKNGSLLIIDSVDETRKFQFDKYNIDIINGYLEIEELSTTNNKHFRILLNDVQNYNGDSIGNADAVEKYMGALQVGYDASVDIPLGKVPGQAGVNNFGANTGVIQNTTEDVISQGGTYQFPDNATAPIAKIQSDNAADNNIWEIIGLDINGYEVTQNITLNGTTPISLNTSLWRFYEAKNMGSNDNVGTITITDSAATIIYGEVIPGRNQTLMAIYTIPKGKQALITKYYASVIESTGKEPKSTRFGLYMRETKNNGVFQIKHAIGIPKAGSTVEYALNPYALIPELTDIKITAEPDSQDADVAAGFDLIIIDI